jgi:RNA polymerase sigma-32 factor
MNAFALYTRDVRAIPMLTAEGQQSLARRFARRRDPRDARRLVLANLRLVVAIAKSLGGGDRHDLMDLVQEGNAGLMVAIERFDPDRGLKLSAYASIWIRAFVLRHIMEQSHVVRATTTTEGRRRFFARTLPGDVRLDAPVRGDAEDGGAHATRLDFVTADERLRPDVAAEAREEVLRLREVVALFEATLDARQRTILESRLLSESPRPLRQLGAAIDLSGERVRQIEQDMLARLRALVIETAPETLRTAA